MPKLLVESGQKYGRLTVIKEVEYHIPPCGKIKRRVLCSCTCGNEKIIFLNSLRLWMLLKRSCKSIKNDTRIVETSIV